MEAFRIVWDVDSDDEIIFFSLNAYCFGDPLKQ